MKKITLATVKSFINKNKGRLFIKKTSDFDGMVDCVMENNGAEFIKVSDTDLEYRHTLGIKGLWLTGGSRNWFSIYSDNRFEGFEISNCCGSCVLAKQLV